MFSLNAYHPDPCRSDRGNPGLVDHIERIREAAEMDAYLEDIRDAEALRDV